jgi:hypothetical protein
MDTVSPHQNSGSLSAAIRLILIPLLVYCAWFVESFLLAGYSRLFAHPDPTGLMIYTVICCIVTGMIIPVFCIRRAFIAGAVTMFQIGFRSARRTVIACSLSGALGYTAVLVANPYGTDKSAFLAAFLLVLPTAIAAVMVCWVLTGTHLQAFVRGGGALLSVSVGSVVTSLLSGIATLARGTAGTGPDALFWPVCSGLAAALFFFAIRDVYATVIIVAESTVFLSAGSIDPLWIHHPPPALLAAAVSAGAVLIGIHWYLSRNFATILVPLKRSD